MTSLDESPVQAEPIPLDVTPVSTRWDRFEAFLARTSERLNPILVKEARQALRSKQFITSFLVMLIAAWVVSVVGLAMIGPSVAYAAHGPTMLCGYLIVLAIPLLIVAPYSAFHSLSAERQDRTYELVSITSLSSRQILSGKMCGIMLQMAIYLSAVFPCLAFSYLLRGIDIFTIFLVVTYVCAFSLGLSVIGLFFATLAPARTWQIVPAVGYAALLFGGLFLNLAIVFGAAQSQGAWIDSSDFWIVNLCFLTAFVNGFALIFLMARARLTTVNQNRSTHLRAALVGCQLSIMIWCVWSALTWGVEFILIFLIFSGMLWYAAGVLLTGESPELSPRVKRDLPQGRFGRLFLSWFTPGPATGYMFAVAGIVTAGLIASFPFGELTESLLASGIISTQPRNLSGAPALHRLQTISVVVASYIVIYLGIGKLLLDLIRRYSQIRLATPILVHGMLVAFGAGVPWVIQMTNRDLRDAGYTLLQITNPLWTITESINRRVLTFDIESLAAVLAFVAFIVWCLNLRSVSAALAQVRVARPQRVEEDEAEQAALAVAAMGPSSPWDD